MPKLLDWKGYKFFFFSNEGTPVEKPHIHVRKGENIAKFWIEPDVLLASSWKMSSKELNILEKKIESDILFFRRKWYEYFS